MYIYRIVYTFKNSMSFDIQPFPCKKNQWIFDEDAIIFKCSLSTKLHKQYDKAVAEEETYYVKKSIIT